MSMSVDLDYELRAEARRQAHLESVRETVATFLGRYERTLSDMRTAGTSVYVAEEFNRAESFLRRAQGMLGSDPELAMSVSRKLGDMMYGFANRARRLRDDSMTADAAARWRGQAAEIRAERAERQAREDAAEAIRERRDAVRTAPAAKSKSLLALAEKLDRIAAAVEAGETAPDAAKAELESAEKTMVTAATDEKLRRETLRAAVETLKRNGFVFPSGPKLQDDGFKFVTCRKYFKQPGECNLRNYTFMRQWEDIDPRLYDARVLDMDERQMIIDALIKEKEAFTKRLYTYLKRYGLSKVHSWTYWGMA